MPIQSTPHTLNTLRSFPTVTNLQEWETLRHTIRTRILASCGLYPLPPRTPLRARIFDCVSRDGYTIEKVAMQTYPGFYLAGNLYRPAQPAAPAPGILIAHGHWEVGRMADGPNGSIPARAITFARMGSVAFTYDMVGYNDTRQIDHKFANDRHSWLWGVSLMGLQTWNSVRALDFLASLPDVDSSKLAITGESGGGTQTMMLGAIDDRLAAVAPCVMVSHTMQGGCLCENAPGLRIDYSNMEIAAAAAPRPQILVGATGDWTATTVTVEGPALDTVYRLYDKPDHLKYVIVDADHNINRTSREAVYTFFGKHLLDRTDAKYHEPPYTMEPVSQLRVFPDDALLPTNAKTSEQLTQDLIARGEFELNRRKPHDRRSLLRFQRLYGPLWEQTLSLDTPSAEEPQSKIGAAQHLGSTTETGAYTMAHFAIDRGSHGGSLAALLISPERPMPNGFVLVDPRGMTALQDGSTQQPGPLASALLRRNHSVLLVDAFLTGGSANSEPAVQRRPFENYFTTYNRTDLQERVQDLVLACHFLRDNAGLSYATLVGLGTAGLWALLAAPAAEAVAADCASLDLTTDDALLADDLFTPCLRRMGDFRTAATLAAPHPLLLHNTGDRFTPTGWIHDVYAALGVADRLHISPDPVSDPELLEWTGTLFSADTAGESQLAS